MEKIFGYDWSDIQRAQQGGRLNAPLPAAGTRPDASTLDRELLAQLGERGLREQGLFGVIDRLQTSGLLPEATA